MFHVTRVAQMDVGLTSAATNCRLCWNHDFDKA